jgi:hypothetical protein
LQNGASALQPKRPRSPNNRSIREPVYVPTRSALVARSACSVRSEKVSFVGIA